MRSHSRPPHRLLLVFWVLLVLGSTTDSSDAHGFALGSGSSESHDISILASDGAADISFNNELARNFHSPRLEYNEWLPVGRGDPLKNDPTYDYSPPVLDRVRYWSDGTANKDKPQGNDILLLGVPSKNKASVSSLHQHKDAGPQWSNGVSQQRRHYYSPGVLHHGAGGSGALNTRELPTILMPPPLNAPFLLGLSQDGTGFWGAPALASQRVDSQPNDDFKYRPGAPFPPPHAGQKLPETAPQRGITAQFLHHHREGPQQQQPAAAGFSSNRQQQPQPYLTTIRLTTPAGDTASIIKRPLLKTILQNEHSYPFTKTAMTSTVTEYTSSFYDPQNINAMAQTVFHPPQTTEYVQPSKAPLNTEIRTPFVTPMGPFATTGSPPITVRPATTTTTTASPILTSTERIFSHYKQPATSAPMERGPLYLIIEGHSKVKTYGLNTNDTLMQLPRMVPVASTRDPIVRHVVNHDPNTGAAMAVVTTRMPPVYRTTGGPLDARPPVPSDEQGVAVDTLLTLLDSASFGEMLEGSPGNNALDGSGTGNARDSKTRRHARN
ncbi:uncharacterized protein LOC128270671 [Anopheles cruzii]|uniref:uncharacterized protein LOC128270671 n=1 Tax=Anopheles cruzii TaxID=68878 RepID=UPI0022EC2E09|nr:uncharacterized protein LOC128270671 [Anopheles cruzii]